MKALELDVVFSGSSTKIASHIGAAVHLESQPDVILKRLGGTSGGAIVAAMTATIGAKEGAKILKDLQYEKYFDYNWKSFLNFVVFGYATSGWTYYDDLKKYFGDTTFNDVEKDLHIVVSNMTAGKAEVWSKKTHGPVRLRDALYISTCIPGVFKPINLNKQMYRDGGVYWNFPINMWKDYPRPRLGFLFEGSWTPRPEDTWDGLKELRLAIDRAVDSNVDLSVNEVADEPKAFCVKLSTQGITALDFALTESQKNELFTHGLSSAAKELLRIRELAEINNWYSVI